jgi:hypothetical protein
MKHKEQPRVELPPTPRTNAAFDLRHNQTCTITWFRQVLEEMERELIAAQAALENANKPTVAKPPHAIIEEDAVKLPETD